MAGYLDRVSVLSGDNIYFQEKRKSSASVATNVSAQASEVCETTRLQLLLSFSILLDFVRISMHKR